MKLQTPLLSSNPVPAWIRDRKWAVDLSLALLLATMSVAVVLSLGDSLVDGEMMEPASPFDWLLVLGPVLAVPFRRLAPTAAVVAGGLAQMAMWSTQLPDFYLSMAVLLYSAAAHGSTRGRRSSWVTAIALTGYTGVGVLAGEAPFYALPIVGLFSAAASAMGCSSASRHAYTKAVEARARQAERSQLANRDRALTEERNRIARELHDVVAHGLSVIVVQSAAAQRIIDRDPAGASQALHQIEQAGRTALTEMRHVLSVVRTDPAESWRPTPGLSGLDELIVELASAGLDVAVVQSSDPAPDALPATVDLTAYRIVQESLTNVLKHGGRGARANVEIAQSSTSLDLTIVDNGRGAAADKSDDGHGLRGMQERVEVFGGRFSAGPRRGGGFAVTVSLPLEGAQV